MDEFTDPHVSCPHYVFLRLFQSKHMYKSTLEYFIWSMRSQVVCRAGVMVAKGREFDSHIPCESPKVNSNIVGIEPATFCLLSHRLCHLNWQVFVILWGDCSYIRVSATKSVKKIALISELLLYPCLLYPWSAPML